MSENNELKEYLVFNSAEDEMHDSFKWTHANTLLLLDLYKEYRKEVGSLRIKSIKRMFEVISRELQLQTKIKITPSNCENRWKVLERSYKKFIDNSKKTGRGRTNFDYADIMADIVGQKKNIHPVLLLSSETITSVADIENILESPSPPIENTETQQIRTSVHKSIENTPSTSSTHQRIYRMKKNRSDILTEIRNDRKQYYKKRLELEEKKLEEKIKKKQNSRGEKQHIKGNCKSRTCRWVLFRYVRF